MKLADKRNNHARQVIYAQLVERTAGALRDSEHVQPDWHVVTVAHA
jgi:hypothetical protein